MASLAEITAELVSTFLQPAAEIESLRAALKGRGMPVLIRAAAGPASANPVEGDKVSISESWMTQAAASIPSPLQPVATLCSGVTAPRYVLRSCECVLAIATALPLSLSSTPVSQGATTDASRVGQAKGGQAGRPHAADGAHAGGGMLVPLPEPAEGGSAHGPVVFAATLVCLDQQLQGTDYYRSTRTVFFVMTERDLQQQRQGSYPLTYA